MVVIQEGVTGIKREFVVTALVMFAAISLLLLPACDSTPVALVPTPTPTVSMAQAVEVSVVGPESLRPVLLALAAAYHQAAQAAPEASAPVQVVVQSRADTLAAQALHSGDARVAVLGWLPPSLPEAAWLSPLARDGLAVVVNPQNGLPGLTLPQLRQLYQGQVEDWAAWEGLPGAPQLVSREEASGEFAFFQNRVMQDARVSLNALLAPSTVSMLQMVAEDPLAVGYVSTLHLDQRVRALAVDGVPPSRETLASNLYPLTRTFFVVTLGEPEGATRGFVQWLLSPEAKAIMEQHGFLPIPEED